VPDRHHLGAIDDPGRVAIGEGAGEPIGRSRGAGRILYRNAGAVVALARLGLTGLDAPVIAAFDTPL
jgi:hypothetical protein